MYKNLKNFLQRTTTSNQLKKTAIHSTQTDDTNKTLFHAAKIWRFDPEKIGWYSKHIRILASNRLIWLIPDSFHSAESTIVYKVPFRKLVAILADPTHAWRVVCPLLEPLPSKSKRIATVRQRPCILDYLVKAKEGEEQGGLLYLPGHLRSQLKYWDQEPEEETPLLSHISELKDPFRYLISPHPMFDCEHYRKQRQALRRPAKATNQHPLVDYLISSTLSNRFRELEPSPRFIPRLWKLEESLSAHAAETLPIFPQAPLIHYLSAMDKATNSCPIGHDKLVGHIDGLNDQGKILGWCKPSISSRPEKLEVWFDNVQLGQGVANQARPDVASRGLEKKPCGFAIELDLDKLIGVQYKDLKSGSWLICTQDHRSVLGIRDWRPNKKEISWLQSFQTKKYLSLASEQAADALYDEDVARLYDLLSSTDQQISLAVRHQSLQFCTINAFAGKWDFSTLELVNSALASKPALQLGVEAESMYRSELGLQALACLVHCWDAELLQTHVETNANPLPTSSDKLQHLATQLIERCYFGPTDRERRYWDSQLRPLFDVAIATLLLQQSPPDLSPASQLIASLIKLSSEVFGDLQLACCLKRLMSDSEPFRDAATLLLQLRSGDSLGVAIALFHQRRSGIPPSLNPYEQALALLDLCKHSLCTIEALLKRLLPLIPAQQARCARISFPRRLLDKLGWDVNSLASTQINQLIASGSSKKLGLNVRERSIILLDQISQTLWAGDNGRSGCEPLPKSPQPPLRWLLIGERELDQCWLYRVEQKRQQLERYGGEARCIDKAELDAWSFSQHILWADAVIFCRTPATYGVIRALTFARHCGKQVFADVDDLVFSSDFPAPYTTYGGSISRQLHRRLGLDGPLQRWPLEHADAVITSTIALADSCRQASEKLATKPISVLPNLPLPELLALAKALDHKVMGRPQRLVVSSGTHAHKQIWIEQLAPALAQLLEANANLPLSLIGHLELPACLKPFSQRIRCIPYSDYNNYLQHLSEATITLVPLEFHNTTNCKSAIKWMEASLLGLATICSPVRAYSDVATPERHLLSANNQEDWVNQVNRLLHSPVLRDRLANQAQQHASTTFEQQRSEQFWSEKLLTPEHLNTDSNPLLLTQPRRKLLVINVYFAPQSFGGATRVAQDQVRGLIETHHDAYDVTVLCSDHDPWQDHDGDTIPVDLWHWNGARIVRLAVPPRPWAEIQDPQVEAFCRWWFQSERFDLIHCHCTQVLTASPLLVAKQLGIPYRITFHDAWWISPELFLVSPAGRLIDPSKPFDHIDGIPTPEEKAVALDRKNILAGILQGACQRLAVSEPFRKVYERAGVEAVDVKENQSTPMQQPKTRTQRGQQGSTRICHIGGMAMHKGYHILRQAVHLLPTTLNLQLTVIDHHLQDDDPSYCSIWNGYPVHFVPTISMGDMALFYADQDVLVAPSIWPESFGLVTREAASAGLFVIASDIGALAEPIVNPSVGIRIEPGNPEALAEAITFAVRQGNA